MSEKNTVRVSFTLPAEIAATLRDAARREHRTPSQQLERLIAASALPNVVTFPTR